MKKCNGCGKDGKDAELLEITGLGAVLCEDCQEAFISGSKEQCKIGGGAFELLPLWAKTDSIIKARKIKEFKKGLNDIFRDNELTETETVFFQAVYDAVLEAGIDPALLQLSRMSDKTIRVMYITSEIGEIKLQGRKTKMQIHGRNHKKITIFNPRHPDVPIEVERAVPEWIADEPLENYINHIENWIEYLKYCKNKGNL